MENYLLPILEKGGPAGAIVVTLVLVVGFVLRNKGWLTSDKTKVVSNNQLSEISATLGTLGTRMSEMENDLRNRPTKQDFHDLEIKNARLEEQMKGLVKTTTATNHAVGRIEEFLIGISKRSQ